MLDSFKSGEKRILKRDSGWGLVVFFFFFHRPAFLSANVYVVHRWDCDAGFLSNVFLIKGKLGGFCVFFTTIGTSIRIFEYILIRFINC